MAFSDLIASLDSAVLNLYSEQTVVIHYQDGSLDETAQCVTVHPSQMEDYIPGSIKGTTVLFLFIRFVNFTVLPSHGDTATYAGLDYDVYEVDADREGGAILRLRRRNQRYDQ
jgi:hypothetical protein